MTNSRRCEEFNTPCFTLNTEGLWNVEGGIRWEAASSEKLSSLSTALRKTFANGVGFYDWPKKISDSEIASIRKLAERIRAQTKGAAIFGIGGSHLGPECVLSALASPEDRQKYPMRWLANVDPRAVSEMNHFLSEQPSAAVVISKSGGTAETLAGFFHFADRFQEGDIIIITDPKTGRLRELAESRQWPSLAVPPDIGGRFSVLTPVGLFPAALGGVDPADLIRGARLMHSYLEGFRPDQNPAYLLALAFHRWDTERNHSTQYLMPYWQCLGMLSDWFVQLWGESLGKKRREDGKAVGFTPVSALGTMDQHSLLQLFKEGPSNKLVGFLDVTDSRSDRKVGEPEFGAPEMEFLTRSTFGQISHQACLATETSLQRAKVPTYRITLPHLNAEAVGGLFFFFETACAFAGELYNVDAFNQPGVEETKKLLKAALSQHS